MEQETGTALLGWSWHGEHVCMDGAGGRGWLALWLKAHGQLLLALLVAWLSPSVAPSSTLSPCLRSATPNSALFLPEQAWQKGSQQGMVLGKSP